MIENAAPPLSPTEFWNSLAPAWERWSKHLIEPRRGLHEKIANKAGINKSTRLLDLATGIGEPALSIAQTFNPASIMGCDFSETMLSAAERRFTKDGYSRFKTYLLKGEQLPFEEGSFDAVTSCFGLEYFDDSSMIGKEILRVLASSGGSCAFGLWGPKEKNPFHTVFTEVLSGVLPGANSPKLFRYSDPSPLLKSLLGCGFSDVDVEAEYGVFKFENFETLWSMKTEVSPPICEAMNHLSDEQAQTVVESAKAACEKYSTGARKEIELPFSAWVISAKK